MLDIKEKTIPGHFYHTPIPPTPQIAQSLYLLKRIFQIWFLLFRINNFTTQSALPSSSHKMSARRAPAAFV